MSYAVEACIVKPVSEGYEICISGLSSQPDAKYLLRVNSQLFPAEFQSFSTDVKDSRGKVVRFQVENLPELLEVLEDGVIVWTSKPRDLKVFDGVSFSIYPSPAKEGVYVHGWCFYDGATPVEAEVKDGKGIPVPVFRSGIPELESQYALKSIRPAFSFALPEPGGTLILSWGDQQRIIDLKPYLQKSRTRYSRSRLRQGVAYLRRNGLAALWHKSQNLPEKSLRPEGYHAWFLRQAPDENELAIQRQTRFSRNITISLALHVQKPDIQALNHLIESIQKQTYENWQLCLVYFDENDLPDSLQKQFLKDSRVHIIRLDRNLGQAAALNEALAAAQGEYIGFVDQDDYLEPDALYEVVRHLQIQSGQIVYTDEDRLNDLTKTLQDPWFKPDFSPDLLRGGNYMGGFLVMESALIKIIGGFLPQYEGAHIYDLILRSLEEADRVIHIPKVLYHRLWRPGLQEVPLYQKEAQMRALQDYVHRLGLQASVTIFPAPWDLQMEVNIRLRAKPLVSVISMTRDPAVLQKLLDSLRQDGYGRYELISPNPASKPVSSAAALNAALTGAHGDLILFLDENTLPAVAGVLEAMAARMQIPGTAIVAARLLDEEQKVLALGDIYQNGKIIHRFKGYSLNEPGYMNLASQSTNVSLTPMDGVMFRKNDLIQHHGLDQGLQEAAWADFCLSVPGRIVATPRISFITPHKHEIRSEDLELLLTRYPGLLQNDPHYSSGFNNQKELYGTSFA